MDGYCSCNHRQSVRVGHLWDGLVRWGWYRLVREYGWVFDDGGGVSSTYPTTLDALSTTHSDTTSEVVHAATVNDLADAVNKIETELGTLPKGSAADVKTAITNQVPKSTVTTAGDLIYATGNAAVTRLALGAAGTVLKGGASAPSFASIVNADVSSSAAIAYSKLALGTSIVNADVSASAAIVYSKLNLGTSIVNADVATTAAIVVSKLADPTTGKVIGSASNAAAAVFPPGYTLAYVEFTSTVSPTATTEATANSVVSAGSVTYDGAAVDVEFFSPQVTNPASNTMTIILHDGTNAIGRLTTLSFSGANQAQAGCVLRRRFTPAAGAKTYSIRAFVTAGTGIIEGGAGGAATFLPGYVKITKA